MRSAVDDVELDDALYQIAVTAFEKKWSQTKFCKSVQLALDEATRRQERIQ